MVLYHSSSAYHQRSGDRTVMIPRLNGTWAEIDWDLGMLAKVCVYHPLDWVCMA